MSLQNPESGPSAPKLPPPGGRRSARRGSADSLASAASDWSQDGLRRSSRARKSTADRHRTMSCALTDASAEIVDKVRAMDPSQYFVVEPKENASPSSDGDSPLPLVRARQPISRGTLVARYNGEVISVEEADRREEIYPERSNLLYEYEFQGQRYCIDGGTTGGDDYTRYLRQSESSFAPNLAAKLWVIDGEPQIFFRATKFIQEGEILRGAFINRPLKRTKSPVIKKESPKTGRPPKEVWKTPLATTPKSRKRARKRRLSSTSSGGGQTDIRSFTTSPGDASQQRIKAEQGQQQQQQQQQPRQPAKLQHKKRLLSSDSSDGAHDFRAQVPVPKKRLLSTADHESDHGLSTDESARPDRGQDGRLQAEIAKMPPESEKASERQEGRSPRPPEAPQDLASPEHGGSPRGSPEHGGSPRGSPEHSGSPPGSPEHSGSPRNDASQQPENDRQTNAPPLDQDESLVSSSELPPDGDDDVSLPSSNGVSRQQRELEDLRMRVTNLEGELGLCKDTVEAQRVEIAERGKRLASARKCRLELEGELNGLAAQLDRKSAVEARLRKELDEKEEEIARMRSANPETEKDAVIAQLKEDKRKAESDRKSFELSMNALSRQFAEKEGRIERLEDEARAEAEVRRRLEAEVERAEDRLAAEMLRANRSELERQRLEEDKAVLAANQAGSPNTALAKDVVIRELKRENEALSAVRADLEAKLGDVREQAVFSRLIYEEVVEDYASDVRSLRMRLSGLRMHNQRLRRHCQKFDFIKKEDMSEEED